MAETEEKTTMEDYAAELDASFRKIQEGDLLTGTVIGVSDSEVTVDLKYYTEGIIKREDYSGDPSFTLKDSVSTGEEVTARVIKTDDGQGHILLSRKEAVEELTWKKLQSYLDEKTVLDVKVGGVVNKGVVAYVDGVRGFIPGSQLSLKYVEDFEDWLGREIQVQAITVDPAKKRLVLSAKDVLRQKAEEERRQKISNLQVGLVTEGKVEGIKPYGAFIDLGDGISGLLHVSQISDKHIKSPDEVLSTGDTVKVKITAVKEGKISLSMKAVKNESAKEVHEERVVIPKSEDLTTSLGDLFKQQGIKL